MNTLSLTFVFLFHSDGAGRGGNPLVSGLQDDLYPEELCQAVPKAMAAPSLGITLTSDEEEEATIAPKPNLDGGSSLDSKLLRKRCGVSLYYLKS